MDSSERPVIRHDSQSLTRSPLSKRETKIKNQAGFFCVRQVYFTKSCRQIWWPVNQPFILFIHLIWGKQYYQALFVYRTDFGQNCFFFFFCISQFFKTNCIHSIFTTIKACANPCTTIIEVNHYKTFSWRKYHDVGIIQWDQSALCIM